jgi:hypothetical protein
MLEACRGIFPFPSGTIPESPLLSPPTADPAFSSAASLSVASFTSA